MYEVIILAAGKLEKEFQEHYAVESKAFIPVGGKMMVDYVLDAVSKVPALSKKILVTAMGAAPPELRGRVDCLAEGGETIIESLSSGLNCLDSPQGYALVIPSDVPLLSKASIEDFLFQCEKEEGEVFYSYLSKKISEKEYPGLHHTYVSLREGVFCGGSLILFSPGIIRKCEKLFYSLTSARKNPLKLMRILGLSIILRFMMKTLSVRDLEERISRLLQAKAKGIRTDFAEAGFNVDDLSTLKRAEEILSRDKGFC